MLRLRTLSTVSIVWLILGHMSSAHDLCALTRGPLAGSCVTFASGEGVNSILEGFTLLDGVGSKPGAFPNGGGVYCSFSGGTVRRNIFLDNTVLGAGGGFYGFGSFGIVLENNVFVGNGAGTGGAVALYDCYDTTLRHNTIAFNDGVTGTGVANIGSILTIAVNNIVWGNAVEQIWDTTGTLLVEYCDVEGGWPGLGNLDVDPLFVDPLSGDLHLSPDSPVIDQGSDLVPLLPATDFEGDPRSFCQGVDMGADEATIVASPCPSTGFLRGDRNADGGNDIADAVFSLERLFGAAAAAPLPRLC